MANMQFFKRKESKNLNEDEKWKILISDDDEDIHLMTKAVLKDFIYKNKELEFISAYNGAETVELLRNNNDIALVLLDVIMESDDAGLQVVKQIRDTLKNNNIQIILRTGQAGQLLEDDVVMNYAINDYKEKTELTSKKLITSVTTSIRSFENIKKVQNLNYERKNLLSSFNRYVIAARADINGKIIYVTDAFCEISGFKKEELIGKEHNILRHENTNLDVYHNLWSTITEGKVWKGELQNTNKDGSSYWLHTIISPDYDIDGKFLHYTAISENITEKKEVEETKKEIEKLNIEIEDTQKEVVFRIGSIAEARSKETGMHVKRVAEYSKLLAKLVGLDDDESEIVKMASPMHDIGKVAIPDNILNKPGKLTDEEFRIMKTHSQIGYDMLKSSNKPILKAAAIIALQHQEKYNGTGYPQSLKGEQIHMYGRITAIADVFDALGSNRVYKKAWDDEKIFSLLKEERGKHFDPELIDLFFANLEDFLKIRDTFKDEL